MKAVCMKNPMYDLIIGNVPEVKDLNWSCSDICEEKVHNVHNAEIAEEQEDLCCETT